MDVLALVLACCTPVCCILRRDMYQCLCPHPLDSTSLAFLTIIGIANGLKSTLRMISFAFPLRFVHLDQLHEPIPLTSADMMASYNDHQQYPVHGYTSSLYAQIRWAPTQAITEMYRSISRHDISRSENCDSFQACFQREQ